MTSPHKTPLAQTLVWIQKGGFAILDQGLFAGTNFLANVLLARWLEPAEYGAFAVAYSAFVCLGTFHTAVLTEPMLIFGAGKYAGNFPQYMRLLLRGHWSVTGLMALLVGLVALLCWWGSVGALAQVLAALALALPCILFQWLVRRAFYVRFEPQWAALGGLLYLALMLLGIYGLHWNHGLSPASALVTMGCASLVVGLALTVILRSQGLAGTPQPALATVLADHWQYGKWASVTTTALWVSREISYPLLPIWAGLEGTAVVRALMNLAMPLLHANGAITILLIPRCVAAFQAEGKKGLNRSLWLAFLFLAAGAVLYWGVLFVCRHTVLLWLYGDRYSAYTDVLLLAGLLPLTEAAVSVLSAALRAVERPDTIFWCHLVALGVALTGGLWLLAVYGVTGAIAGRLAASLAAALVLMWFHGLPSGAHLRAKLGRFVGSGVGNSPDCISLGDDKR